METRETKLKPNGHPKKFRGNPRETQKPQGNTRDIQGKPNGNKRENQEKPKGNPKDT